MNSIPIHKIAIGAAVVAVFGVGISVIAVDAKHDSQVARNVPATSPDQSAIGGTDATAPAPATPEQLPADSNASLSAPPAPTAAAAVIAPAPGNSATGKVANTSNGSDRNASARNSEATSNIRVASAARSNNNSAPASVSSLSEPPTSATADTQPAALQMGQEAATSAIPNATSNEPVASDSQITTDVKSQLAMAAPNSNVGVTTTNGVVELAGSVPSQDAVEQARQAARGVAGVKFVDVSALTVSNQ
jgi:hyperosmotically inducible protein